MPFIINIFNIITKTIKLIFIAMTRKGDGRQEEKGGMRLWEAPSLPLGLCAHARGGGIVVGEKHTGIVGIFTRPLGKVILCLCISISKWSMEIAFLYLSDIILVE